jgi:ribosomal protein S18 acetylase RimI-like enzyme
MTPDQLSTLIETSWPAARLHRAGPWLVREGQGGGQRVSAATAEAPVTAGDIAVAEAAQAALGQPSLFLIRKQDAALDLMLAQRDYLRHDPVVAYAVATGALAHPAPNPMAAFPMWPPLAIAEALWAEAGIGPGRQAVMHRVKGAKTAILGRINDRASGVAFVACAGDLAMLHALEVTPSLRRQGSANNILRAAAVWAQIQGATTFSVVVTEANEAARKLYASLGMEVVGQYHYRKKQNPRPEQ